MLPHLIPLPPAIMDEIKQMYHTKSKEPLLYTSQ
jgi:hypothetical protein